MPPHKCWLWDWSRRPRNSQPLGCCKPRLLGSNGWTQSLKPLLWVAATATATTTMSSNVLHKVLDDQDIHETPGLGPPSQNIGPVPSAVRRVSVDGVKLSQSLITS